MGQRKENIFGLDCEEAGESLRGARLNNKI